jgi:uncharacterized repeat protein (TIGR01451 family)
MFKNRLSFGQIVPTFLKIMMVFTIVTLLYLFASAITAQTITTNDSQTKPLNDYSELPIADVMISEGFRNDSQASLRSLWVGYDQSGGYNAQRSLLQFNVSPIPSGSQVTSAMLWLYADTSTQGDNPMTVTAHRVQNSWDENTTIWASQPQMDATSVSTTDIPAQDTWVSWDITSLVQDWVDDPGNNFGVILKGDENVGQHERGFWSKECLDNECAPSPGRRPRLDVQFATATPTPTPPPTATPTNTPTNTPTPTPTQGPSLNLTLEHEPDTAVEPGDQITYTINYENDGAGTLNGVVITGHIPLSTTFLEELSGGGITETNNIVWDLGELSQGQDGKRKYVVELLGAATSTASTMTPTNTATSTLTPTNTTTSTMTPTNTATSTLTPSPTTTMTATLTVTPTMTATLTATPTMTATLTATPTMTGHLKATPTKP